MARIETWFDQDLKQPVKVRFVDGNVFSADSYGNLVGVNVFDNGEPATLSGTVSANVIRPDGSTVGCSGAMSSNRAYTVLPPSAYAVPGLISIIIKLTTDVSGTTVITTLCAVTAVCYRSTTDTVVDPGTIIPSVQALIDQINSAIGSIPADYSTLWNTVKYYNSYDVLYNLLTKTSATASGITFTWSSSGETCSVSGTASNIGALNTLLAASDMPSNITPGNYYWGNYSTTNTNVRARIIFKTQDGTNITEEYFDHNRFIHVPSNAKKWAIGIFVTANAAISPAATITCLKLLNATPNSAIDRYAIMRYVGDVPSTSVTELPYSCWWMASGSVMQPLLGSNFVWQLGSTISYVIRKTAVTSDGACQYELTTLNGVERWTGNSLSSAPDVIRWNEASRSLKVLIFGNSSTYSTWGYAPSLMNEACSGATFKVGLLYSSGGSFASHISAFNDNTAYSEYSLFSNGSWTNSANTVTAKAALSAEKWDVIAIQQSNVDMMSGTGVADAETLCGLIAGYIDYPVQFVFNMPMTKGANCSGLQPYYPDIQDDEAKSDAAFADFATYSQQLLENDFIADVIPCGTAIQNARHTSLKTYGDNGYMCVDDVGHLQNGIGVLCSGYVVAYKLLEILNERQKMFGSALDPTDAWLTTINLWTKSAHGSCVGITDANKLIAQKCAMQAIKHPFAISQIG